MYEVPDDYVVPEQLPGMLETTSEMQGVEVVGESPLLGLRIGERLAREIYISRFEPLLTPQKHSRIVTWRPIGYRKRPVGWVRSPLEVSLKRATAFTHLVGDDYATHWSSTAQRDLRHAQERGVRVEAVPFAVFMEHMPRQGKFRGLFSFMSWQAERFHKVYADNMRWYLAYNAKARVAAALGVLYLPEHNFSMSGTSYSIREADERSAPVALRDRWHKDALKEGITYLDWNALWRPGDARSWRGFGAFKEKFKPNIVYLPPTYITFVPSIRLSRYLLRLRRLFRTDAPSSREAQ